mmetsp:Transcript_25161/g.39629  ORF Transcript_25161/g.39629 Transcript_25161/m.39629 type:complete len:336 (+) Transcript_25161:619-1626(+)
MRRRSLPMKNADLYSPRQASRTSPTALAHRRTSSRFLVTASARAATGAPSVSSVASARSRPLCSWNLMWGRKCLMCSAKSAVSFTVRLRKPSSFRSILLNTGCSRKYRSSASWSAPPAGSALFFTITYPSFSGLRRFEHTSATSSSLPRPTRSGLVSTASVRRPSGSAAAARSSTSCVAMSWLAGTTASTMVAGWLRYASTMRLMAASVPAPCPAMRVRTMPGRSMSVKSGNVGASISTATSCSLSPVSVPSVAWFMSWATWVARSSGVGTIVGAASPPASEARAFHAAPPPLFLCIFTWTGHLVTKPAPRGSQRPLMLASTELLPLLWSPTTQI